MARIRTIKPEFWSSEQVMELSRDARLAFIGLWNFCDDRGVHPASARTLKAEVFPGDDDVTAAQVIEYVNEMAGVGLVQTFDVDGRQYWAVTGWKHQYIKHPAVKYPPPPGHETGMQPESLPDDSPRIPPGRGECSGSAPPVRPPEGKGKEGKVKEREEEKKTPPAGMRPRGASVNSPDFDRFWSVWPKRVGKAQAEKAWQKLNPDDGLLAAILAAVARQCESDSWRKDGGAFIPHAATWLNGRRWEDEVGPLALAYTGGEIEVMTAYNVALVERGWPSAVATPFSPDRAVAIREFAGFGQRPGWMEAYFAWLAEHLPPKEGFGFDWAIQRGTYLRAREGNFAALREAA